MDRRNFVRTAATAGIGAAATATVAAPATAARADAPQARPPDGAPHVRRRRVAQPIVVSDITGYEARNGGTMNALEMAYSRIVAGADVLDALIAGVNIPELDPAETGVGFGGLPNGDGVVQLDACCMHGPTRRAGGVAAIEGVRTPSRVAHAVMQHTDHHLLVGRGAQDFARQLGFTIEEDLNTPASRQLWLEWKRRLDSTRWLDPARRDQAALDAALGMLRDGLIREHSFWGTISCNGINAAGDIAGVTTTSGLAWKIPGRVGDSPIIGAGLYVDNDVGAAGSTGRGEANLYNLTSYLIVENMRRGMSPKDAAMEGLRRIHANTVEPRLLNERGEPGFNIRFFALNKEGVVAGCSMYATGESQYAVCTENGSELRSLEPLLPGEQ
jgi:N4-(beta-N-acetylglucosaminyl)-L-asparaginase